MVRSYLRHEPTQAFGLICSPAGRATLASDGKTATVAALEDVLRWDVKTGEQMAMWHETGHSSPVTAIAHSPQSGNQIGGSTSDLYAVGYADGSIRVWDALSSTVRLTLNGHKSAITALQFDQDGLLLVSGSQDTNITLWDIVAENGLFRLKGHRDAITDLSLLRLPVVGEGEDDSKEPSTSSNQLGYKSLLCSTSKDGLLKVWDLALQHCLETVLPGKGELWSLSVLSADQIGAPSGTALILVGNSEGKLKIYEANAAALISASNSSGGKVQELQSSSVKFLADHGQIDLVGGRRVSQIGFKAIPGTQDSRFIGVSASDKSVELFRIRTQDDIRKKMARRRRRAKEKAEKKNGAASKDADEADTVAAEPTWQDRLEAYTIIRPGRGKIKSFAFAEQDQQNASSSASAYRGAIPILLAMANNSLEVFHLPMPKKNKEEGEAPTKEATLVAGLDLAGHRSEVRAIALSSDDSLLATADSAGSLKIWNAASGRMVRTLPCGYALSLAWLPDDQHVLVGCKDGTLKTYDVRSGVQLEDIPAHQGPIWSVAIHPDGQSCLTASGDKDVKFWEFESRSQEEEEEEKSEQEDDDDEEESSPKSSATLGLAHIRTLKMTDDVLCAKFSPDGRLLALALLDSTVKVFYADSLKFFLSLYGHKLPVLSLDISGDSKLCVTVSADKNAKIWGLDYGDCHRSLFAHEESVMAVAFEKGDQGGGLMGGREGVSHRFWTCAKDGKLKYWDGDKFQCVQTMSGHHGDVTGLAVGSKGTVIVSAGLDRSIRVWEKTEEPLFLEEERERELEEMYEGGGQKERDDDDRQYGSLAEGNENQGQPNGEVNEVEGVTRSTKETMLAGERLLEAIELATADLEGLAEYERQKKTTGLSLAPPARNPIINHAFGPGEDVDVHAYVLKVVSKILPAQLDDALLVLPFDGVMRLMIHLNYWASKEWNMTLVARILFFLLRNYHGQIVSNRIMRTTLQSLRRHLRASLQRQKMTIGYNLAGLQFVKSKLIEKRTDDMYMRDGFDLDEETVKQRLEQNVARKRKMVA
ncbi:WD40 repeat-like protein [Meira miltonrushii]|uniref:WD40 repeat-like protein n=1 Tax=Meira miltonrushii TaxID=1280837 RepID=A0A316V7N9_9BASI|nr:WD40 repeat-like protein [Meira miltonrushii]PWN33520.1 WD40 repeat-like protein [Meira miltonrushii]